MPEPLPRQSKHSHDEHVVRSDCPACVISERELIDRYKAGTVGVVYGGDDDLPKRAQRQALHELRTECDRLRSWIDTEGRNCPSSASVDAVLGGNRAAA